MRRRAMVLSLLLLTGCQANAGVPSESEVAEIVASVFDGSRGSWVDLTHSFSDRTIYWPTDTLGFTLEELAFGPTDAGYFYAAYRYSAAEHGGTHLDAPIHFAEGRQANDEIPLSSLMGPAAVIDLSDHTNPDYLITVEDLTGWEAEHGEIQEGAILLLRTGWDVRYEDRALLLGTEMTGSDAVPQLHFPGLSTEAAEWLVENRSIKAIGIDTPSVDYGQSTDFSAHVVLYQENIPGFENLANLDRLPATGSYVVALPMKIQGGSGGPLRIVGYLP